MDPQLQTIMEEFENKFGENYAGCHIEYTEFEEFLKSKLSEAQVAGEKTGYEAGRRAGVEEAIKALPKIKKGKFPRGERKWCLECASRIVRDLKSSLTKLIT